MNTLIEKVRLALRIDNVDFDDDISDLVNAALMDLGIAGVITEDKATDPLIIMAVKTYCKVHFGDIESVDKLNRLKASYDEQKAQLQMSTGYTTWI